MLVLADRFAEVDSWPQAVVYVAFFAFLAVVAWAIFKD